MRQVLLAWTVATDPVATQNVYREIRVGAAATCGCAPCRNFDTARPALYPRTLSELLDAAAIDPCKETKVKLVAPLEHGLQLYAGTYLFCGEILAGRAFRGFPFLKDEVDVFERIGDTAHVALRPWLCPEAPWAPRPCVRLEFLVVLPWVLEGAGAGAVNLGDRSRCLMS